MLCGGDGLFLIYEGGILKGRVAASAVPAVLAAVQKWMEPPTDLTLYPYGANPIALWCYPSTLTVLPLYPYAANPIALTRYPSTLTELPL